MGWGKREIIYLSLRCHHRHDSCIKMGSDESHFNVSVGSDGQSHKTVSTNHNLFEEKGEPRRYRTEVLPLNSLTPYQKVKPAHLRVSIGSCPEEGNSGWTGTQCLDHESCTLPLSYPSSPCYMIDTYHCLENGQVPARFLSVHDRKWDLSLL